MLSNQRTNENTLKQQNEILKTEKKAILKELEELKSRIKDSENSKQNNTRLFEQWKKEKIALLKKIEIVSLINC